MPDARRLGGLPGEAQAAILVFGLIEAFERRRREIALGEAARRG